MSYVDMANLTTNNLITLATGEYIVYKRQKTKTHRNTREIAIPMTLQSNSVPREVISQTMGHTNMKTTNVYLDSFATTVIDSAAMVL